MKDAKIFLASDGVKGYNKEKTNAEFFAEASDEQKLFPSGNRNPESYKYVTVSEGVDGDVQFRFYNNQKLAERNMQIYSATTGNKIELVKVGESGSVSQAVNTIFGGNYGRQENAHYGEGRIRNFAQRSGGSVEGIYGASEEARGNDNFRRNDRKIFEASSRNVQGKELISEATDADIRISDGVSEESSALAKKNGAKAISFEGELKLEDGGVAEGFYSPDTDTIGAQIDNVEFEQADLIRHEIMERKIAHGEVKVEDAVARARQLLDDPTLIDSCAEYLAAHYCAKNASDLTPDEIAAATKELVCDGADHLNRLRYVVDNGYVSAKTRETADAFDLVLDALNQANRELTGGAFDIGGETQLSRKINLSGGRDLSYSKKDYNDFGWASELFEDEDMVLLKSKIMDTLPMRSVGGRAYPIEANNKIVMVSGNRTSPRYESVLVINADNSTDFEIIREILLGGIADAKYIRTSELAQFQESICGVATDEYVVVYKAQNYQVNSRSEQLIGNRATLPKSFKNFSYIKDGKIRNGVYSSSQRSVSERNGEFRRVSESERDKEYADAAVLSEITQDDTQLSRKLPSTIKGGVFPPSNKYPYSYANTFAMQWANNDATETGARALISFDDSWYIIEKYDSADNGYLIEERLTKKEYERYIERERVYRQGTIQIVQRSYSDFGRGPNNLDAKQSIDNASAEKTGSARNFLEMDSEQNKQRAESASNGERDNERGSEDISREASRLTSAPVSQEISSAKTSIKQIPALFKDKNVSFGKVNVDIGGGRFAEQPMRL